MLNKTAISTRFVQKCWIMWHLRFSWNWTSNLAWIQWMSEIRTPDIRICKKSDPLWVWIPYISQKCLESEPESSAFSHILKKTFETELWVWISETHCTSIITKNILHPIICPIIARQPFSTKRDFCNLLLIFKLYASAIGNL